MFLGRKIQKEGGKRKQERSQGRQRAKSCRVKQATGQHKGNEAHEHTHSKTSPTLTTTFKLNIKRYTQNPVQVRTVSTT